MILLRKEKEWEINSKKYARLSWNFKLDYIFHFCDEAIAAPYSERSWKQRNALASFIDKEDYR